MFVIRTPEEPRGDSYPEWLAVIHMANQIDPGIFGRPEELKRWWAGGSVEEYPDARVIFVGDESVRIVAKTKRGDKTLREVAKQLGIHGNEDIALIKIEKEEE